MKAASGVIGVCLLTMGCGGTPQPQSQANPAPARSTDSSMYSVSGRVFDTGGRPVISARVEVLAPGFEGLFVTADPDGSYRIQNLAGGVRLEASKTGFVTVSRGVNGPEDAVVDFTLESLSR